MRLITARVADAINEGRGALGKDEEGGEEEVAAAGLEAELAAAAEAGA